SAKQPNGVLSKVVPAGEKVEEIKPVQVSLNDSQLGLRFEGKALNHEGPARASATVSKDESGKLTLLGSLVWPDGSSERLTGERTAELKPEEKEQKDAKK